MKNDIIRRNSDVIILTQAFNDQYQKGNLCVKFEPPMTLLKK